MLASQRIMLSKQTVGKVVIIMLPVIQRFSVVGVLLSVIFGIGTPLNVYAHVKWFTEPEANHFVHSFTRLEVGVSIALLLVGIVVAKFLSMYCVQQGGLMSARITDKFIPLRIFQYVIAIYLAGCAWSGNLLVPHVGANQWIVYFGVAIQFLIAALLFLGYKLALAALLLCLMFALVCVLDQSFLAEYLLLAGIAAIIYAGHKVPGDFAIKLLRIVLGISLIALALTEKLLQPELALNVLAQHSLNFMTHLGIGFSDSWFVLGAGMVELFIGLLFVLGLMVRTTTLVILGLMVASNFYFFWIGNYPLAMMEFIGHLPVFAAGILLLFYYGESIPGEFISNTIEPMVEAQLSIE